MKTEEAEADKLDDTWMVHAFFLYLYSCNMAVGVQASMHHWRRGALRHVPPIELMKAYTHLTVSELFAECRCS